MIQAVCVIWYDASPLPSGTAAASEVLQVIGSVVARATGLPKAPNIGAFTIACTILAVPSFNFNCRIMSPKTLF